MAKTKQSAPVAEAEEGIIETSPDDSGVQDFGKIWASWEFPEFIQHSRSRTWYTIAIILLIGMLIYAYFSKNLLFAIILILFTIIYFVIERRGPVVVQIAITEDGILINDKFIEYSELADFYIIYYPPDIKNLYFQPRNRFKERIAIPLEDQNPVEIRRALIKYLAEDLEKEEMPTSESLSRIFKI